jgi:hypothetical protein
LTLDPLLQGMTPVLGFVDIDLTPTGFVVQPYLDVDLDQGAQFINYLATGAQLSIEPFTLFTSDPGTDPAAADLHLLTPTIEPAFGVAPAPVSAAILAAAQVDLTGPAAAWAAHAVGWAEPMSAALGTAAAAQAQAIGGWMAASVDLAEDADGGVADFGWMNDDIIRRRGV